LKPAKVVIVTTIEASVMQLRNTAYHQNTGQNAVGGFAIYKTLYIKEEDYIPLHGAIHLSSGGQL
jgi:hypothetical protein